MNSQYEQLLDLMATDYRRYLNWDELRHEEAKEECSETAKGFYKALALHNASNELHGPDKQ
jgi:hypothetical protein